MASFDEQPTTPMPTSGGPWIWFDGEWLLMATDTDDGIPESLDFQTNERALDLRQKLRQPDGGFTLDPRTGQPVTKGFAVAVFERESREIPEKDLTSDDIVEYSKDSEVFADPRNMFGGWHDPDSGRVWLDVSTVVDDKAEAIELAKQHNQISIFDLDTFEVINTGGTGRSAPPFGTVPLPPLIERVVRRHLGRDMVGGESNRANPYHDKLGQFATSSSKGFGTFTKSEATVIYGASYVKARIWNSGQNTIIVSDNKFPDELVEKDLIPTINHLQATNPLPSGEQLNVSVEPVLFHRGNEVYGLTMMGTGNIKLNGSLLRDGGKEVKKDVESGHLTPAGKEHSGLRVTTTHEWGHAIDTSSIQTKNALYAESAGDRVSRYADTSSHEAKAENFTEFDLSGGKTDSTDALKYAEVFGWHS